MIRRIPWTFNTPNDDNLLAVPSKYVIKSVRTYEIGMHDTAVSVVLHCRRQSNDTTIRDINKEVSMFSSTTL